jgi:hypothetical protein
VITNHVKAVKNLGATVDPLHGQAPPGTGRKDFEAMGAIGQEGLGLSNFFFGHGRFLVLSPDHPCDDAILKRLFGESTKNFKFFTENFKPGGGEVLQDCPSVTKL